MWGYGIQLSLLEDDGFSNDHTNVKSIDCYSTDLYQTVDLAFDGDGVGQYKLFGKMTTNGHMNQASHKVHEIDSEKSNKIDNDEIKESKNAIKLEYLLNPFHLNDEATEYDEMNIAIYSDVYDQMFTCGEYRVLGGDVIDFGGLVVPCNEMVAISIKDSDFSYDDGQTMLISCSA